MRNFVIGLLAAGLWLAVVVSMALVRRSAPGHPFRSIRLFRRSNRALASSAETASGYEPPLFGSGPWPMESPLDRSEPEAAARPMEPVVAAGTTDAGPDDPLHEEDFAVIQTLRRKRRHRDMDLHTDTEPAAGAGEHTGEFPPVAEAPAADTMAEAPAADTMAEVMGEAPGADAPASAAEEPVAPALRIEPTTEWGPSRRGLFRRRRKREGSNPLSPTATRTSEEPRFVVRVDSPRDDAPAAPDAAEAPAASAPEEAPAGAPPSGDEAPARPAPRRRTRRKPASTVNITDAALARGEPYRIITLADDESEDEEPQPAAVWVQRVVQPEPQPSVVLVPDEPVEVPAATEAQDDAGPLAYALRRASEGMLEGPHPERSAPAAYEPPPGSMPVPLPFLRGIGRTRDRLVTRTGPPPPIVHIQTIDLDRNGDPVIITAEEAAAAEAEAPAAAAVESPAEPELSHAGTEEDPRAFVPEPPVEPWEAEPVVESWEPEPVVGSSEPEPPVEAPWAEATAAPAQDEPELQPEVEEEPPAPAAAAPAFDPMEAFDEDGNVVVLPAAPKSPVPQPEPATEPLPAARRVARPAPIGPRPDRTAASDAKRRSRLKRPAGPRTAEGDDTNVILLSTGSAVRPRVTVNLTQEDIEDSDELYEVEALLSAITREPRTKPRPSPSPAPEPSAEGGSPAGEPQPRAEAPSPQAVEPRPEAEAPSPPRVPLARPVRPESRPIVRRPAAARERPAAPQRPAAGKAAASAGRREDARAELRGDPWVSRSEPVRSQGNGGNGGDGAHASNGANGTKGGHGGTRRAEGPARPERRREATARTAGQATQQKAGTRRRANRPVTLILVDEEGRPQLD